MTQNIFVLRLSAALQYPIIYHYILLWFPHGLHLCTYIYCPHHSIYINMQLHELDFLEHF